MDKVFKELQVHRDYKEHLFKAFTEMCKARDVNLTKQVISKTPVIRAERAHLQIDAVDKVENER